MGFAPLSTRPVLTASAACALDPALRSCLAAGILLPPSPPSPLSFGHVTVRQMCRESHSQRYLRSCVPLSHHSCTRSCSESSVLWVSIDSPCVGVREHTTTSCEFSSVQEKSGENSQIRHNSSSYSRLEKQNHSRSTRL
jgi:hypothetical protein